MDDFSLKQFKADRKAKIVSEFAPGSDGKMVEYQRLARKYRLSVPTIINYIREAQK